MTERQRLHNEIKRLKSTLNINTPSKWTIKTIEMKNILNNLRDIESRSLGFESKENIGAYQIRKVDRLSSDINHVKPLINNRLDHALRSFTGNSDVVIHFFFQHDGITSGKSFRSFHLKDRETFWNLYRRWIDLVTANTPDYIYNVEGIRINIVRENGGGCSKRDKITHKDDIVKKTLESSNNNCFFNCVFDKLDIDAKRVGRVACNKIRTAFGLEPDSVIPISKAIEIFDKYKKVNITLRITDNETLITHTSGAPRSGVRPTGVTSVFDLILEHEHYSIITRKPTIRCNECGKTYRPEHKCTPSVVTFFKQHIKKTGERFLLHNLKPELVNNKDKIIHYDLETFKQENVLHHLHTAYYCGYTDEKGEFAHFSGESCVSLFLDHLIDEAQKAPKDTLYVNAFNPIRSTGHPGGLNPPGWLKKT